MSPADGFSVHHGESGAVVQMKRCYPCAGWALHPEGLAIASVPWLQGCDRQFFNASLQFANMDILDSIIPGLGRSPGEENGRCFITQ